MQAGANFFATVKPIVYIFVGSAIGGFILKLILDAIMRKRQVFLNVDMNLFYKYFALVWSYVDSFFYLLLGLAICFYIVFIILDIFVFKNFDNDDDYFERR